MLSSVWPLSLHPAVSGLLSRQQRWNLPGHWRPSLQNSHNTPFATNYWSKQAEKPAQLPRVGKWTPSLDGSEDFLAAFNEPQDCGRPSLLAVCASARCSPERCSSEGNRPQPPPCSGMHLPLPRWPGTDGCRIHSCSPRKLLLRSLVLKLGCILRFPVKF